METVIVYFSPLLSTKILGVLGLGVAYHMAIVYTDANGVSFGASSGPSDHMTPQTPALALHSIIEMAEEKPSAYGVLVSDPKNDHPFVKGRADDYYTQDFKGQTYPSVLIASGPDLSAQWRNIVATYAQIGAQRLTYSPIFQNSNSLAGTSLRVARLPLPSSSGTPFAPAEFTELPARSK